MKEEIDNFLAKAYQSEAAAEMKDVYVTNHEPKTKKYFTTNSKEDEEFYRYKQAVADYNSDTKAKEAKKTFKFEKGTFLQKIFDPMAGAERLENGALFYKLEDSELTAVVNDEEKLRKEFEKLKALNEEPLEVSEEDENELRIALLDEMEQLSPFTADEFNEVLDKEFSVFKTGEKYDFVKDMKDAYSAGLQKTTAEKILDTIPEHVFWDIKTPRGGDQQKFMNPYNPFRKYPVASFFDSREYETYMDRRTKKNNLDDGISTYRRY